MGRLRIVVGAALLLGGAGLKAQDSWIGGFPDYNYSNPDNWSAGAPPSSGAVTMYGSQGTILNFDVAGAFDSLTLTGDGYYSNAFVFTGAGGLTLNGGVTLVEGEYGTPSLTFNTPLTLPSDQTWSGSITVNSTLSGAGDLILGGGFNYAFNAASSGYSGSVEVEGDNTVVLGASGAFGSAGLLQLDDGATLQVNPGAHILLGNPLQLGDASSGQPVTFATSAQDYQPASLALTGNIQLAPADGETEIEIGNNLAVTFGGTLTGQAGQRLEFADTGAGAGPAEAVLEGSLANINELYVTGHTSLIFLGSGPSQLAGLTALSGDSQDGENRTRFAGTYIGFGPNFVGQMSTVLSAGYFSANGFEGTLGFDTASSSATTFTDTIDLTAFSNPNFIGLGSATKAILAGTIIPEGGLAAPYGTLYNFGGGGGTLTVTSALTDSTAAGNPSNVLQLRPGNAPLTLILSGANTYTGGTTVDGSVLIFDSALTTSGISVGMNSDVGGYAGATANASVDTAPQSFISHLDTGSFGVVGFDNLTGSRTITGAVDLTNYPGLYLGSATAATYTGTITPDASDSTYKFAGVKGGTVTIASALTDPTAILEVGLPVPLEYNGSYSTVILTNAANSFSGGTTLNTGMLAVAQGALGTGAITVVGPSDGDSNAFTGIEPSGASVTLGSSLSVALPGTPVHLNYAGSPYLLTINGQLSEGDDTPVDLRIDGPVTLANNNYLDGTITVNGTQLTGTASSPTGSASLIAQPGSTLTFSGFEASIDNVTLNDSVLNVGSAEGGTPQINGLIMEAGSTLNLTNSTNLTVYYLASDLPTDNNVINLNGTAHIFFDVEEDPDLFATIQGTGSVEVDGQTVVLSGHNTYSGGTTIDSYGTIMANNAMALGTGPVSVSGTLMTNAGVTVANPVTLQSGGSIAGYGTLSHGDNFNFTNYGTLAPGLGGEEYSNAGLPPVGALTFSGGGTVTFGTNGYYNFSIVDANGTPGVGYSTANITGTLAIAATAESPFTISLYSFGSNANNANAGPVPNFNAGNGYTWVLATATGGITGFSASAFAFQTNYFTNSLGTGGFYVTESGNELLLNFSPVPEPSTIALLGVGAGAVGALAWRRRRVRA